MLSSQALRHRGAPTSKPSVQLPHRSGGMVDTHEVGKIVNRQDEVTPKQTYLPYRIATKHLPFQRAGMTQPRTHFTDVTNLQALWDDYYDQSFKLEYPRVSIIEHRTILHGMPFLPDYPHLFAANIICGDLPHRKPDADKVLRVEINELSQRARWTLFYIMMIYVPQVEAMIRGQFLIEEILRGGYKVIELDSAENFEADENSEAGSSDTGEYLEIGEHQITDESSEAGSSDTGEHLEIGEHQIAEEFPSDGEDDDEDSDEDPLDEDYHQAKHSNHLRGNKRQISEVEEESDDEENSNPPPPKKRRTFTSAPASVHSPTAISSAGRGGWSDFEADSLYREMVALKQERIDAGEMELYDTKLFDALTIRLRRHDVSRTASACKNYWSRYGRDRYQVDERDPARVRNQSLSTSQQVTKKKKN